MAQTQPEQQSVKREGPTLFKNLSFHFLWSSTLASGFGDRMAMLTAMALLGFNLNEQRMAEFGLAKASIAAAVDLFFWLPYVIWGPFAGWLADRLPRKWIMFVSDEARGLVVLLSFALMPAGAFDASQTYNTWFSLPWGLPDVTYAWQVYFVIFMVGMFAATFNPARTSVIPSVVGFKWLQAANSVAISFGVIGNLIGLGIGGPLAESNVRWCIFLGAAAYLLSGSVWAFLKTPYAPRQHGSGERLVMSEEKQKFRPISETLEGMKYIMSHRPLKALMIVSIVFWSGSSVVLAGVAYLTGQMAGGGTTEYAIIGGAMGGGMLVGAMILGWMNARDGSDVILVICLAGSGVTMSILMVMTILWIAAPVAFISGIFAGGLMITITTMMQRMTPNNVLGRVIGSRDMVSEILKIVALILIWQIAGADAWMRYVVWALGAVLLGLGVYGFYVFLLGGRYPKPVHNLIMRCVKLYMQSMHRLEIKGKHHVPTSGPTLIISNHTAGTDPCALQCGLNRHIRWIMLRTYELKILGWFWKTIDPILVDRDAGDSAVARTAITELKKGEILCLFPESGINPDREKMMAFKNGVALIAKRSKAPIVPAFISGTPNTYSAFTPFIIPSKTRVRYGKPFTFEQAEAEYEQMRADGRLSELENVAVAEPTASVASNIQDEPDKPWSRLDYISMILRQRVEALRPSD